MLTVKQLKALIDGKPDNMKMYIVNNSHVTYAGIFIADYDVLIDGNKYQVRNSHENPHKFSVNKVILEPID